MKNSEINYEFTRQAIRRVIEWAHDFPDASKQDLCEVAMTELHHTSVTKAHAVIDVMVAMQYLAVSTGDDGRTQHFQPTIYGLNLLDRMHKFYEG